MFEFCLSSLELCFSWLEFCLSWLEFCFSWLEFRLSWLFSTAESSAYKYTSKDLWCLVQEKPENFIISNVLSKCKTTDLARM